MSVYFKQTKCRDFCVFRLNRPFEYKWKVTHKHKCNIWKYSKRTTHSFGRVHYMIFMVQ